MQGPNMVNGDPAGLDFDFPRGGIIKSFLGDRTSKNPVQMMIQNRSPVRTRNDEKAAIFFRHIIDANPDGQQVVIGKRIPSPILMPFHWAAKTTGLHVQLITVGPNGWSNKLGNDIENFVVP